MREPPPLSEDLLRTCLHDQYDRTVRTLEFLPLGLDTRAGVYRVVSEQGDSYLIKARIGTFYESSCLAPRYLHDQGIAAVVAPLPTKQHSLWACMGAWTVVLYPFIVGVSGWQPDLTDGQWEAVGRSLRQIHQIPVPPEGLGAVRQEAFDPSEYIRWMRAFATEHLSAQEGNEYEQMICAAWIAHQTTIDTALHMLATLAGPLRERAGPYVICHADLHASNLIRDDTNQVFIIDWDDVMLAPKERDFLFVGKIAPDAPSPFLHGYGPTEIDWMALTYYHWERVIQDLIECARIVFLRDDLGEATKAGEAQLFCDVLAEGGQVDAARRAMAHI